MANILLNCQLCIFLLSKGFFNYSGNISKINKLFKNHSSKFTISTTPAKLLS